MEAGNDANPNPPEGDEMASAGEESRAGKPGPTARPVPAGKLPETPSRRKSRFSKWLTAFGIAGFLVSAYLGSLLFAPGSPLSSWAPWGNELFRPLSLSGEIFFRNLFISGLILCLLAVGTRHLAGRGPMPPQMLLGILAVAVAISLLLAADAGARASTPPAAVPSTPVGDVDSLWSLLYSLITEHQALLVLTMFMLPAIIIGCYYVIRSLFSIQYEGTGVQIRLPGQTVFYVPLYPQFSWQDTKIQLREGQRISVEISGYVSPGALGDLGAQQEQKARLEEWMANGSKAEEFGEIIRNTTWPYTDAGGYPEEWYHKETMLDIFEQNPIYKEPDFYLEDPHLTIRGLPHNRVVGMIVDAGDDPPRQADGTNPGYDWHDPNDRMNLINLSKQRDRDYPLNITVGCSGDLWVVINDVDSIRWDNGGWFFLKITVHGIL